MATDCNANDFMGREGEGARALVERYKYLKDVVLMQAQATRDVERALKDLRGDLKSARALLTRHGEKGLLLSLGLALIALPEPFFSNIAGAALVALGSALKKRSSKIEDLIEAFRELSRLQSP